MVGFVLKAVVKSKANSLLAYKELEFESGNLILKDLVLFDIKGVKSSFLLHSEKTTLAVDWKWPFSFFIHVEKPHLLIAPEQFKKTTLSSSKSRFKWSLQLEEGRLEWADQSLPSSQFSILTTSDDLFEMGISWERGTLEINKKGNHCLAEWSYLPFEFLLAASKWGGIYLPISECQGALSGHAELNLDEKKLSLTTKGDTLSFTSYKTHFGGSIAFEGAWKGNSLEKIRLFLDGASARSLSSEITNIGSNLTYQAGLGIKLSGNGVARRDSLEFGVEWEGRSFLQKWVDAKIQFGNAVGSIQYENEWLFEWENVADQEIAILQGFAANLLPSIRDWSWQSGTIEGKTTLQKIISIELDDVLLETPLFDFATKNGSYKNGDWEVNEFRIAIEDTLFQGSGAWHSEIQGRAAAFVGEIAGIRFAGTGEIDGKSWALSIPRFEGEIPPCLWPGVHGKIGAVDEGFSAKGSWDHLDSWHIYCKVAEGIASYNTETVSNFECTLIANPDSIDILSAKGQLSTPIGEYIYSAPFFAPRIQWKEQKALFDLRLREGATDFLRLKGTKEGENFTLDSVYSHFFGEPIALKNGIWKEGAFTLVDVEADLNWTLVEPYLRRLGLDFSKYVPQLKKAHFAGKIEDQKISFSLQTDQGTIRIEKKRDLWNSELLIGQTNGYCTLEYKDGLFRANTGRVLGPGVSFDFEGTMNRKLEGDLIIKKISADLKHVPTLALEGNIEGQAQISFTKEELQSDLDLVLKEASYDGFSFENATPLHLYYSSLQGTRIKGIDCRIQKQDLEAHAKIDLLKFEKQQNQWSVQKVKTHIPADFFNTPIFDSGLYLDCLADLSFSADLSEWNCTVKEALIPLGGSLRHIKDLHLRNGEDSLFSEALIQYKTKWAKLSLDMTLASSLRGRLYLSEPEKKEPPLSIDWTYEKKSGLSILSIEGAFAGLDASFHAFERGKLIGSTRVDFKRLSDWLPNEVARGFDELKLGKGYELKGNLQIDPYHPSQLSFQGLCCGKQVELAGFQFRTLMARADLSPNFYRIYDVKVSDSAGILKIDDIQMKQENELPWTIAIPKFTIEELRPSLLVKPGETPGPVSPLVIRQFKMEGFHGLLDDGNTWVASGQLSFINSYKREETVFDLPANVLGRIVGLDLDLLIPVKGELIFDLHDGYFNLNELKGAYSEGRRSEFFLVQTESNWPRVDLDGNLEILVKMKQFVLFSLTEAFMISIDGKLNDPHFSLQKKKRFL